MAFYGGATIIVSNSTISGNLANSRGGGVYGFDTLVKIDNSTITKNLANDSGSGIYLDNGGHFHQ